jgi:hypothetical protein
MLIFWLKTHNVHGDVLIQLLGDLTIRTNGFEQGPDPCHHGITHKVPVQVTTVPLQMC